MKKLLFSTWILAGTLALAASSGPWLHIRIQNSDGGRESVSVNVPLWLAEKFIPNVRHGRIRIGNHGTNIEPRALIEAVRDAADGEFVNIESDHEYVRVAKSGGYLLMKVHDNKGRRGAETIDIKMPLAVVEALLASDNDELNLSRAIRALAAQGNETILTVDGETGKLRIWVDGRNNYVQLNINGLTGVRGARRTLVPNGQVTEDSIPYNGGLGSVLWSLDSLTYAAKPDTGQGPASFTSVSWPTIPATSVPDAGTLSKVGHVRALGRR